MPRLLPRPCRSDSLTWDLRFKMSTPRSMVHDPSRFFHSILIRSDIGFQFMFLFNAGLYTVKQLVWLKLINRLSVANLGDIRDTQGSHTNLGLKNYPQVYVALEHRLVVAEVA
ncbi:hypothetical protein L1887_15446 [Cichorium endivia]|nr:hypothetical protein L1887_15446 [Cichorium endivia]